MFKSNLLITITIIALSTIYRLIPHPFNVSPIYSIALFTGATFNNKYLAAVTTILSMLVADIIIGLHNTMVFTYLSLLLINYLGHNLQKKYNYKNIIKYSVISSLIFYLISNFGVWLLSQNYTYNLEGLVYCYWLAIPFWQNTLISCLLFNTIIFTLFSIKTIKANIWQSTTS